MRKTVIEKIVEHNTGRSVKPGDIVTVNVDRVMIHDIFIPFVAEKFKEMGFEKLWDPDKVVLIYDHLVPASQLDDTRHFHVGDAFAAKYGMTHVHRSDGICHQLMTEAGYVKPGDVAFGTDSHTTTYGCVGAFSSGIGYTEMASILGTGTMWIRVPETIKVVINGKLLENVMSKDVILRLIGDLGADGATYKALEFSGSAVESMTVASTGIKSVEDLKGKRVGIGAPNSGVELNARMIYEAYGMTYEDSDVDYLSYGEAIDQMKNGQCDAAFVTSGLPNATVSELAFSYDMVIVPIDGEGRDNLIEKYPFFSASTIPANTYNNKEDVESVFVYNIMLVNKDVSDDMVYDMLDCIFSDDGIATIKASHNTADKNIDVSFGVDDVKIPLHDGAAKWWQDHGYETPEN